MHWLETTLAELAAARPGRPTVEAAHTLVMELGQRPGVLAVTAAHDGLPLAAAGESTATEALAAFAQRATAEANAAAGTLDLGAPRQVLFVGATHKVAILCSGNLQIALLSAADTPLSEALAAPPAPVATGQIR